MNRQHPFFSRIGCLGGAVLIAGLVVAVVLSGGAMFSPGTLTAYAEKGQPLNGFRSHADFQEDCRQCHAPFQGVTAERCETCHTAVRDERAAGLGLHGRLDPAEAGRCGRCHDDHQGPDLDPSARAVKVFDHAVTGFSLARHVVDFDGGPLPCRACHTTPGYTFAAGRCAACHTPAQPEFMPDHAAAFGETCTGCHDGADRTDAFDHSQTQFPLEGRHAAAPCARCHSPAVPPADVATTCAACHAPPASHLGALSDDCAACHEPVDWKPGRLPGFTAFDHAQTAFQLVNHSAGFDGAPLNCAACHAVPDFAPLPDRCLACHRAADAAFMDPHVQAYGQNCVSCHDGAGNMRAFDHARLFPLDGAHAALACERCHTEQRFRGTPRECAGCHQEPEIHAGLFGQRCEACHATAAWAPARLTQHTFPLDHGEAGEIPCATCHTAAYTAYTCFNCHAHEPNDTRAEHDEVNLAGKTLDDCAGCHATGRKEESEEGDD